MEDFVGKKLSRIEKMENKKDWKEEACVGIEMVASGSSQELQEDVIIRIIDMEGKYDNFFIEDIKFQNVPDGMFYAMIFFRWGNK